MVLMEKSYRPGEVEKKWNKYWQENHCFEAKNNGEPTFTVFMPPPNVTGILHMGHTLNNTIQDVLCRWARINGKDVLWIPGTDHAGIATQSKVENVLKKEGLSRQQIGREAFLERVQAWRKEHGCIIFEQLKSLGVSCDWSHATYTLDPNYSRGVLTAFVRLYKRGYIYKGKRLVNWCPVSQTALSDEEVIMKPISAVLYTFKYAIVEKPGVFLNIATTRPETIMGDVALAVHPEDVRYQSLIGLHAQCPFDANRTIPIIADAVVDRDFGTGALKITPAHDPIDFAVGQRHHLPFIEVLDAHGNVNEKGAPFEGMSCLEARKAVVAALKDKGLLVEEKPYEHAVGFSERANVPVEPRLSEQWFVRYPKVEEAKMLAEENKVCFWPQRWIKTYLHWLNNIQDWCISRQLWWGHRIPVWYHKEDKNRIHVSVDGPKDVENWEQDPDVLDTWFSSWLWPLGTLDWLNPSDESRQYFNAFFPSHTLVSGPDILFFWITRMIIASLEFLEDRPVEQRLPFKNIYLTGIVRDALGRKMSKSLGNSPDPIDLINNYGADGVRIGLLSIAPQGQDIRFDERFLVQGRNFCTKLWNACRYRQMQGVTHCYRSLDDLLKALPQDLNAYDKHLLMSLLQLMKTYDKLISKYEFSSAIKLLQHTFKSLFCDDYLEIQKIQSMHCWAVQDLFLRQMLIMLEPYAPYITEELWSQLHFSDGLVQEAGWDVAVLEKFLTERYDFKQEAFDAVENLRSLLEKLRGLKAENGLASNKTVEMIVHLHPQYEVLLQSYKSDLEKLVGAKSIHCVTEIPANSPKVVTLWGTFAVVLEHEAQYNVEGLKKDIASLESYITTAEQKLKNQRFIEHAPANVIEGVKKQLMENQQKLESLKKYLCVKS
jgi:valyl-tRNA synthetase